MIKKPGDITENKKNVLVVVGPPGVGKTTLSLSALNPVLIDSDGKLEKTEIEHYAHIPIICFHNIPELLSDMQTDTVNGSDTITIDTAGTLISYLSVYVIRKNPKNGQGDGITLNRKGWGAVKTEFIKIIDYFRLTLNKHVVIICHAKETTKTINGTETYWYDMDVPGSSSVFIEQKADLMCMMEMYGDQRTLGFSPTSHYKAKSAYGIKGVIPVPGLKPGDPNNFLTNLFIKIDNYRKVTAEKAKVIAEEYEAVMGKVRSMVDMVTDTDTANNVITDFQDFKFPFSSQREAWTLLRQKAESIGLRYDRESKRFVIDNQEDEKSDD